MAAQNMPLRSMPAVYSYAGDSEVADLHANLIAVSVLQSQYFRSASSGVFEIQHHARLVALIFGFGPQVLLLLVFRLPRDSIARATVAAILWACHTAWHYMYCLDTCIIAAMRLTAFIGRHVAVIILFPSRTWLKMTCIQSLQLDHVATLVELHVLSL